MLVTPVMCSAHTYLSHPSLFSLSFSRWQQITQLWILIYTQTLGKSTLHRRECVTDNTLKKSFFFSHRNGERKTFSTPSLSPASRSTWKIKSASHVCHHTTPDCIYSLHFTRCWKLFEKIPRFGNEPAKRHIIMMSGTSRGWKNEKKMKDWVFMYNFMRNRKKWKKNCSCPQAFCKSSEISVSKLVKAALTSLLIVLSSGKDPSPYELWLTIKLFHPAFQPLFTPTTTVTQQSNCNLTATWCKNNCSRWLMSS